MITNERFNCLARELGNIFSYVSGIDSYELVYVNENLKKHLGLLDDCYIGGFCYEVVYGFSQPCYFCTKKKMELGQILRYYKYNPKLNCHYVTKTSMIETDAGFNHMCVSYDISKQFEQIKELKETLSVDNAIVECAKTMFYNENIDVSLNMLLKTVCDYYQSHHSYILEIDDEQQNITTTYEYFTSNNKNEKLVDIPLSYFDNVLYMASEKDLTYFNLNLDMLPSHSNELKLLKEYNLNELLLTSLNKRDKLFGFIGISNPQRNHDNQELVNTIAPFIINDITKRHVRQKLEDNVAELNSAFILSSTMLKCANALISNLDYNVSIENLLEIICDFYGAGRADIFQLNSLEDKLINTHKYFVHNNDPSEDCKLDDLDPILFRAWFKRLEKEEIIYVDSLRKEYNKNSFEFKYISFSGLNSYLVTGLHNKGKLIGFLGIVNPTNAKENNMDLLQTVSAFVINYFQKSSMINKLEELSFADKLTGLKNRNCYLHTLDKLKQIPQNNFGIIFADVNGLKKANDNLGHEYGDILIRWCGDFLKKHLNCNVFRIGGDEFVAFVHDMTSADFFNKIQEMRHILFEMKVLNMSMGATYQVVTDDIDKQITDTDKIMYLEKRKYYILKQVTGLDLADDLQQLKLRIEELKNDLNNVNLL